jgi:hypothetical protein
MNDFKLKLVRFLPFSGGIGSLPKISEILIKFLSLLKIQDLYYLQALSCYQIGE